MPDIINLLPDSIANQIAAGEVVQRPASVVKELLENSIDAGSKSVQLIIKEAGKTWIQVVDDGKGMSETDARMCFERHATSKIKNSDDLFKIKTMGFRGEALASIAAVARVELKTKTAESELGTFIHIEASEFKKQELISANTGTSICIKNLFYNVPARRNFLKSNGVETRHILDEFQRIALSNPEVSFTLTQNDSETYNLPAGKLSQRIVSLFGKNHQKQLITCDESTNWVKVYGYVGKPENSKKTRGEQFFFVNNRFIKNNYLNHAVYGAYEGMMRADGHPFYVLFIEMDPVHVDINVHPTKTEVKFDDERSVYGIVKSAVKQALGTHHVTPSLDFSADVNFENIAVSNLNFDRPVKGESGYGNFKSLEGKRTHKVEWEKLYETALDESTVSQEDIQKEEGTMNMTFASKANSQYQNVTSAFENESNNIPTLLHQRYIVKQVKSGMMLVYIEFANERILYEKYKMQMESRSGSSQRCLFPQTIELNPADHTLVMELKPEIEILGFEFEDFGSNSIVINGVPAEMNQTNEKELFEGLIEQFKFNKSELSLETKENIVRAISKRAASRINLKNDVLEMNTLIDRLFACQQPNYTSEGNPIFVILGLEKISEFFKN